MRVALEVINLNLSDIFTPEYVKIPIRVILRHYHHLEKILKFPLNSSNSSSSSSFGVENFLLFTFFLSYFTFSFARFFVLGCAHPSLNINKNEAAAAADMYVKVNVNVSISKAATVVEDDDP